MTNYDEWVCKSGKVSLINHFLQILGQDRNFALERYGTDSRCFDHTEQMWEERSCEQVSIYYINSLGPQQLD